MDLLRVHHCFFSFEDVEELVEALRQFGSPVRIESSYKVEDCNRVTVEILNSRWRYTFVRFVCDNPQHAGDGICTFSFEISFCYLRHVLAITCVNLRHDWPATPPITCVVLPTSIANRHALACGDLNLNSSTLSRIIQSRTGHLMALYHQSDAQRKLYQLYGDVLVINIFNSCVYPRKTLLAISVIKEDGVGSTVCLVILPGRISLKVVTFCFEIFSSSINPSRVAAIITGREELMPSLRKAFPGSAHLISQDRMLQQVTTKLSTYTLEEDVERKIVDAFLVCCTTDSEHEFGFAEMYLTSIEGEIGIYFETRWFEQTDIWRTIDRLRRIKKKVDVSEVTMSLYRKLAQTGFFK